MGNVNTTPREDKYIVVLARGNIMWKLFAASVDLCYIESVHDVAADLHAYTLLCLSDANDRICKIRETDGVETAFMAANEHAASHALDVLLREFKAQKYDLASCSTSPKTEGD